jgi:nucleoid-associated protein YgaU
MTDRTVPFNEVASELLTPDGDHNLFAFLIQPNPDGNFERVFLDVRSKFPHAEIGNAQVRIDGALIKVIVQDRDHTVAAGEDLIKIANEEYDLQKYSPDLWRTIAEVNGVENPFTFDQAFLGKKIRIPVPRNLVQAVVEDWIKNTNAEVKELMGD